MADALLIPGIVAAVVFAGLGLQLTVRFLHEHSLDARSPGSLLETNRRSAWVVRPAELERLQALVATALADDGAARARLWPLLDELEAAAPPHGTRPGGAGRPPAPGAGGGRRRRARALRQRLDLIEAAYGIGSPTPGAVDLEGAGGGP